MARNGKIRSKLNHNKIKEIVEKTQATCSTCVLARNCKIRLNHNKIKEIVEKSQATCSKCLKQVNGAIDFFSDAQESKVALYSNYCSQWILGYIYEKRYRYKKNI